MRLQVGQFRAAAHQHSLVEGLQLAAADQLKPVREEAERQQGQKDQPPRRPRQYQAKEKGCVGPAHGNRPVHVVKRYFLHAVPRLPFARCHSIRGAKAPNI